MCNPVMFVSLGPGDPELITMKGLKVLQEADIIFCPSTTTPSGHANSRAKDILLELKVDSTKVTTFDVPMSKNRSMAISSYTKVALEIAEQHRDNCKIVVTAEGDAGFYSSSFYISDILTSHHISTARVAGIPAFIACGTLANIHVAKQEEELHVIPGIISAEELENRILTGKNLTIMKASQCEGIIKKAIINFPEATFHYFENVGVVDKELYTTDNKTILSRKFPYFSLIIIHPKN